MLRQIRAALKSWVVILLMGLLVISFAVWGVGDVFSARFSDAVIQAGSREVSPQQFQTIFQNYRRQIDQQQGRPVTPEELAQAGVLEAVVRQLAADEAFSEILNRLGVRPADSLVVEQLRQQRAFFDPVTGQFSQESYRRLLAENNLTPEAFEAVLRDELAQNHFAAAVIGGTRAPRTYGALTSAFNNQTRAVSWMVLTPAMVQQPGAPTDAQLTAFMQENASALRRPEFRVLTILRFSAAEQAASAQVSEADVQRIFQFRRDSLSQPERRTFVQVTVPDAAAGQRAVAALRAGQEPAAVARAVGGQVVNFADQPRTAVPDRAVAEAAFSLTPGQTSDVVRGGLALSVIKLTGVTPAVQADLAALRPQIEQELRGRAANERVSQIIERYEASHGGGATLLEAARAAGVTPVTLPPVAATGQAQTGQPTGIPPQVLRTAFELPAGGESDVEQAGEGEYYAVRVDRIIPPSLPPLAEVRDQLARVWTLRQVSERLEARANELAGQVRGGRALAQVGQAANATVNTQPAMSREMAGQSLGRQVAARVFAARPGEVVVGANTGVYLVARVDRVASPAPASVAVETEAVRDVVRAALLREMSELARRAAERQVEVRTDLTRARQAAGLDTAAGGARPGAPPAAPAAN